MRLLNTLLICVNSLAPAALLAEQGPELDVAVTYSAQQGTVLGGGDFWAEGGSAEVSATFYHGLGETMNVAGTRASSISPSGVPLTMVTSTFGPRYTWSHPLHGGSVKGSTFFGQALIGVAQGLDSVFPSPTGARSDVNDFALQIGGGADLLLAAFRCACAAGGNGSARSFPMVDPTCRTTSGSARASYSACQSETG